MAIDTRRKLAGLEIPVQALAQISLPVCRLAVQDYVDPPRDRREMGADLGLRRRARQDVGFEDAVGLGLGHRS